MNAGETKQVRERLDHIYRNDSRRIFATLVRLLGDFDLAEDALQEAFATALKQWPQAGIPANPTSWLISAGRFKVIDALRQRARINTSLAKLGAEINTKKTGPQEMDFEPIEDDQLRLIFTCCHPALFFEARVALTLREVCGLQTEEIAHAFLIAPSTLAQRIVRAKAKIREDQIPYEVPSQDELHERLDAVLQVIYLVFNEGYTASSGESLTRPDLSGEAIRLGRLLVELLPEPEAIGLLALMLLHEARHMARRTPQGDLILFEDQDRSLWNQGQIAEGIALTRRALSSGRFGAYTLQAAIAGVHATAPSFAATDWAQVISLYDMLLLAAPSPVVELNRAVALAMRDGPAAGLARVDELLEGGELGDYYLAYSVRADLCRRLGRTAEARDAYRRALDLTQQAPEQRYLERRLAELQD